MKVSETIIVHPGTSEKVEALKAFLKAFKIKFEVAEKEYSPEFIRMLEEGDAEYKKGETKTINTKDLWK